MTFSLSCLSALTLGADRTTSPQAAVIPWLILLVGFTVAGGVVIMFVRRWLRDEKGGGGTGFTLQDLRDLHASGELSEEEFTRARTAMIERAKGPVKPVDKAGPTGNQPPAAG